jgi:hypothetical protein
LLRIDNDLHNRPIRVIVTFAATVEPQDKPELMRAAERYLKTTTERTLQLYHEQLKDQSTIRRL